MSYTWQDVRQWITDNPKFQRPSGSQGGSFTSYMNRNTDKDFQEDEVPERVDQIFADIHDAILGSGMSPDDIYGISGYVISDDGFFTDRAERGRYLGSMIEVVNSAITKDDLE